MRIFEIVYILWHYLRYRHGRPIADRAAFEARQRRIVAAHVDKIRSLSPFYRARFAGRESKDWESFPILNKAEMMANFDSLNTVSAKKDEVFAVTISAEESRDFRSTLRGHVVGMSTGTSGSRGIFLLSEGERRRWAAAVLAKVLPASGLRKRHRIALFMRAGSRLYESVSSARLDFRFFDMKRPLSEALPELTRFQPSILVGPPLLLRCLSEAQDNGSLAIGPQKIVSVAEVLDDLDSAKISASFHGQPIHQIYQCTEGFLGTTCAHGTLHLNEDLVAIQKESLGGGRFFPIITDFSRVAQPLIRYRLDDILVERADPCPCGSIMTAIDRIEGRSDDSFLFRSPEGEMSQPVFPGLIRYAILNAASGVTGFTIEQHTPTQLTVRLGLECEEEREKAENAVSAALRSLAAAYRAKAIELNFAPYEVLLGERKLRRVQRHFRL